MGVSVIAHSQLIRSVSVTTTGRLKMYSPKSPGRTKAIGMNTPIVVKDDHSRELLTELHPWVTASACDMPSLRNLDVFSDVTIELSTRRPSATISAASEICSISTCQIRISAIEVSTIRGIVTAVTMATRIPAIKPRITRTNKMACIRLLTTSLTFFCTNSGGFETFCTLISGGRKV